MNKLTILAGAAALGIAGAALAQPAATPRLDRQADVTRQQVIERADQRFARLDVDNDGRATADEARQAREQRRTERAGAMFERMDADRDGSVSRAEFDQARAQRGDRLAARHGEGGAEAGHRRHGPRHRHGMRGMRGMGDRGLFGEQGFITREQMRERALARFDRLDANRDGTLTFAERQQAREQFRAQRRERREQAQ
jgi:Ca2+-binding EF-hand superfamily protein